MPTATRRKTEPLFKLLVEANPVGEVTPVVPVTWTISSELIQKIESARYTNPHVLIVVASRKKVTYGTQSEYNYEATKVYAVPLTATPKEYV